MPQRLVHVLEADRGENSAVGPEQLRRDEEIKTNVSQQLTKIFGPSLSAMKLAGELYGETTFTEDAGRRKFYISRYYSAMVVLGQWALVLLSVTSQFYEGFESMNVFLLLLVNTIWFIQCACSSTICFVWLSLTYDRRSKFAQFISSFLETRTEDIEDLRPKTLKGLAIACAVAVINAVVITILSASKKGAVSSFKPWEGHLAIRAMEMLFGVVNSFAWLLPLLVFCVTCLVLERMFEVLKKKDSASSNDPSHIFTIGRLRQEHLKLCDVVELANKVFSLLMFVRVATDIPLICVNVYQLTKTMKKLSSGETEVFAIISSLYWSVCLLSSVAVMCIFGSKVNEKVGSTDMFLVNVFFYSLSWTEYLLLTIRDITLILSCLFGC